MKPYQRSDNEPVRCERCPAFVAIREWDGTPRYVVMTRAEKTAEGAERQVDVFDGTGKPVYRKDAEGRSIELGQCTVAGPDERWMARNGSVFPIMVGTHRCECPEKWAAIERLGLREYGEA